jgi:hypothetical protein
MSGAVLVPVMQFSLRAVTLVSQSTEDCELQVSNIQSGGNLSDEEASDNRHQAGISK